MDDDASLALTPPARPEVEVRRSRRRQRTVSAYRQDGPEGDKIVVMIPSWFSTTQEQEYVEQMLTRLAKAEKRHRRTDEQLMRRARDLSRDYLFGKAQPASVRWVDNMTTRWASCTPGDASIRMSDRLQGMPAWVVDYVLLHELAHLLEPSHNARFWHWVDKYPRAERAKGYLDGVAAAGSLGIEACD
jgi:hypothetical protein